MYFWYCNLFIKSAEFQLCITARTIIIFRRTARARFVLCFCLFLNPGAQIMLNLLFNTLLTITPHNTQKRRRRKERTTYGPLRRYWWLVTHPVLNPDGQGLTWVPLPNRVSQGNYCEISISSLFNLYWLDAKALSINEDGVWLVQKLAFLVAFL